MHAMTQQFIDTYRHLEADPVIHSLIAELTAARARLEAATAEVADLESKLDAKLAPLGAGNGTGNGHGHVYRHPKTKASRDEVMALALGRGHVGPADLVQVFGYKPEAALTKLREMKRAGLLKGGLPRGFAVR